MLLIEILASLLSALAASIMDFNVIKIPVVLVLSLFLMGNLLFLITSFKRGAWSLFVLMIYYTFINCYGIYHAK